MITVCGQRGDNPPVCRTVTMRQFVEAWGRFALLIWRAGAAGIVVDDMYVWVER